MVGVGEVTRLADDLRSSNSSVNLPLNPLRSLPRERAEVAKLS